ncbi:MAG: trigger factor [Bacteroidales bacterium]|jgi:trigger factor|nr:trigger factor [Bacteroidales bacterium]
MEVVKNQIDDLNATLTVNVKNSDIDDNVEKTLRDYRRKAVVPGFRPGNVPMGLIKKMYGNAVIAEELNRTVSNAISDYLVNEKINILGDPLPNESQEQIEFGKQDSYDFSFDIGLIPEFEIKLSKRDKVNKYSIKVDDEMIEKYISGFQKQFGGFEEVEQSDEDSMLNAELIQTDKKGNVLEDGVKVEDAAISIKVVKDKKIQKSLIGISNDTVVDIDIKKAFPNDSEITSLLKINKEDVENLDPHFRVVVKSIKNYKDADINQEFFNKCFGENVVNSEEEFRNRVTEDIKASFTRETKYKLLLDIKDKITKKSDIHFPEEFLRRWLKATNKDITEEQLNDEFPRFIEDLKWTLIKSKIAKENEIKITEEELINAAKQQLIAQFSQYGMSYIPDEYLTKYANEILQKEGEANKLYEMEIEEKVVDFIADTIKTEDTEISIDEFQKLFE